MIDYEYEELFRQDSTHKDLRLTYSDGVITNSELQSEKFEFNDSICSQKELAFGCCESSYISFSVGYGTQPLEGKTLSFSITPQGGTELALGDFTVVSDTPTADKRWRDIVAYDNMYKLLNTDVTDWYNHLFLQTESVTCLQFRNSLFTFFNVQQENVSLINDTMTITKTIDANIITGKDVLNALCEINACFGKINRFGRFEYIYLIPPSTGLFPALTLFPGDDVFPALHGNPNEIGINGNYISAKYEDYVTAPCKKVQIRQEENDIGVIVGAGENIYVIEDNFLVYGKSTEELTPIAQNILEKIRDIYYCPATIELVGNPCIQVGDAVKLVTKYKTIETFVLQRNMRGIQALKDTYVSEGSKTRDVQKNSLQKELIKLKGKSNVLERTIEQTQSTISDVESGLQSQITQNATSISSEVTRATGAESTLQGNINNESARATGAEATLRSSITQTASEITSAVASTYETKESAVTRFNNAKTYADGVGTSAINTADSHTDNKLLNYSNTQQMNSAISQSASNITSTVAATYATQASLNTAVDGLQAQIDNRTTLYTVDEVPTLNNYPANEWTTDALKDQHINDMCIVSSVDPDHSGYNYRFEKKSGTYQWTLVQDTVATQALQKANEALQGVAGINSNLTANYSTTQQMNSAITQASNNITSTVAQTYETKVNVSDAVQGAKDYADDVADDAVDTAEAYTDTQLASYATTANMNSAIAQSASNITSTVSATYETKSDATSKLNTAKTYADGVGTSAVSSATASAKNYTDGQLSNYSTTTQMNSAITQSGNQIKLDVAEIYERADDAGQTYTSLQSQITQNAGAISTKVEANGVISAINQSSEQISIDADKINLNGVVTANNNFVIDQDGKMTAVEAQLTKCTLQTNLGTGGEEEHPSSTYFTTVSGNGVSIFRQLQNEVGRCVDLNASHLNFYNGPRRSLSSAEDVGEYSEGYMGVLSSTVGNVKHYGLVVQTSPYTAYGAQDSDGNYHNDFILIRAIKPGVNTYSDLRFGDTGSPNNETLQLSGWMLIKGSSGYYPSSYHDGFVFYNGESFGSTYSRQCGYITAEYLDHLVIYSPSGRLRGSWSGSVSTSSDRRLKKDIENLNDKIISAVGQVELKQFIFNHKKEEDNTEKIAFGAIAQEVIKAFEDEGLNAKEYEVISSYDEYSEGNKKEEYYTLNYDQFLVARNAYLEKRVDELEQRIAKLEEIILKGEK